MSFVAEKSPQLNGRLMQVGDRVLVDWNQDDVDAEAWLQFDSPSASTKTLSMTKVDPNADFSYDYEDLAFTRVGNCR